MTIATIKKIKKEIKAEIMKEFITPLLRQVKDPEGEYKQEFVEAVFSALKEKPKQAYSAERLARLIL